MKDMLEVLKRAKQKDIFRSQEEFKEVLEKILSADTMLKLDWDDGAGEEWARFSNQTDGIVCMINAKLKLIFIRHKYNFQKLKNVIGNYEVVFIQDYCSDEWRIDVIQLKNEIPYIYWHASENAVNTDCFSLDDFYFATI